MVAHSPQEVGRAVAGEREDAVSELELFCDPDVSDQDLCRVRMAGFEVHRLTMQEIRDIPTWWYQAAQALYSDSHPLGGELVTDDPEGEREDRAARALNHATDEHHRQAGGQHR